MTTAKQNDIILSQKNEKYTISVAQYSTENYLRIFMKLLFIHLPNLLQKVICEFKYISFIQII